MSDEVGDRDPKFEDDRDKGPLRLGVVCVHGIGRQRFGDTARDVAQAVEAGATLLGGEFVQREPTPGADCTMVQRASVQFPGAESYDVQFYDGWWDERVENPKPSVVLGWIWRVLPFALWTTTAFWAHDLWNIRVSKSRHQDALRALLVLMLACGMLIAALILLPVMAVVSMVCIIPMFARKIWPVLSLWPGDAWLYRSDSLDQSVIAETVDLVQRVSNEVDTVMLVGHSQGAEIARRVAVKTSVGRCVWVGSGESQLGMLRILRRSRWVPPVLWTMIVVWPATFAAFFNSGIEGVRKAASSMLAMFGDVLFRETQGAVGEELSGNRVDEISGGLFGQALHDLFIAVVILVLFWTFTAALIRFSKRPLDLPEQPECEVVVVKSLIDPVCFGPNKEGAVTRYVPVARPYHKEHIHYFGKPETGVAILEALRGPALVDAEPHVPRFPFWVFGLAVAATCALTAMVVYIGNLELSLMFSLF